MRRLIRHQSIVDPSPTISRRQMLAGVAAIAAPPLVTAIGVARAIPQLDDFRIRQLHLALPGLPPNLDGLRIAHLSDIHVGRYTRRGTLPKIVDAVNGLKADLVLFTGDLIDLSLDDLDRGIDAMKRIDPRHGLAMIEGNHDLIENADAFDRRTKAAGLPLLVDEAMTIPIRGERVQLLGMRWGSASGDRRRAGDQSFQQSLQRLLPQRENGAHPILLAHHPHAFDAAAAAGLPLTLSGHTHGGQLMLNERLGFGPVFFRYWSGLYRKSVSQLVVSNGVGNWFPLRTNAPAEIVELVLHEIDS
jgi:predicted MPP superfamily phosphohydrolase